MAAATAAILGLGAVSTMAQTRASRENEKMQARISNFNAELSKRDAELALESSIKSAEDVRKRTQQLISSHRAAFGASNLVTTSGSPLLAQLKQAEKGEIAAQDVLVEGRLRAAGFDLRADLDRFEAEAARTRGRSERQQILLSGLSRGLGTAGSLRRD
jgi:hypothetical protein